MEALDLKYNFSNSWGVSLPPIPYPLDPYRGAYGGLNEGGKMSLTQSVICFWKALDQTRPDMTRPANTANSANTANIADTTNTANMANIVPSHGLSR